MHNKQTQQTNTTIKLRKQSQKQTPETNIPSKHNEQKWLTNQSNRADNKRNKRAQHKAVQINATNTNTTHKNIKLTRQKNTQNAHDKEM